MIPSVSVESDRPDDSSLVNGFITSMENEARQTDLDQKLAAPMFYLTLAWLAIAGIGMHVLQDPDDRYVDGAIVCGVIMLVLWVIYFYEAFLHWNQSGVINRIDIWSCIFPPLRLCGRDHVNGETAWLPILGWREANDDLANEIELKLSYTMIAIALLVLPLLGFEFFFGAKIAESRGLGMAVQFAQAFIWFAFAAEFIVSIGLVKKKLLFAKEHWLDLLIICLPMIAFMRLFRLTGAARLTRLSKSAKIFRLRGTAMRAWRAILILEIVDRILHRDHEKRIQVLEEKVAEKKLEIAGMEAEIESLRQKILLAQDESIDSEQAQDESIDPREQLEENSETTGIC